MNAEYESATAVEQSDYEAEDTLQNKYLTFGIGSETYGIEIRFVTEIVVMQKITKVPDMPDVIKGVINLRGTVISVMDMRTRFNFETREYDDRTCIVVVEVQDTTIGMIVDQVNEVMDISSEEIDPPPRNHSGINSRYIEGMGKVNGDVKILLNIEKILYEDELDQVRETVDEPASEV